jgi:hypothetical protein
VDYSKVNAYRQGAEGVQGQYLLRFGRLIRNIERHQAPHPVFFLAENVFLSGDDRTAVMEAFGMDWDPIALDAQYFPHTPQPSFYHQHSFARCKFLLASVNGKPTFVLGRWLLCTGIFYRSYHHCQGMSFLGDPHEVLITAI